MILMVLHHASKNAKSEPLEMGINGEDLAFCGLKSKMSHHFIKKLEQRLNVDKNFFNVQRRIYERK